MTKIDWPNASSRTRMEIIRETQDLLGKAHPTSRYTARADNIVLIQEFWRNRRADPNIQVAKTDDCIIFYKKFNLGDPHDKIGELKKALAAPHNELGDCLFVDFGVAAPNATNEGPVRDFFLKDPTARHVMGVRRGVIFLFSMKEAAVIAAKASALGFISSHPDALQ
jgi:hypothetical protein